LRQVARRIQHCLRDEDTLARLGGDEFAIMLDEAITSEAEVIEVARRVIEAVSKPYLLDRQEALIGTSIGVAVCGRDDSNADPAVLLRQADMALYRAKAQQRGSYCLFRAGMDAALNRRKDMERDLRRALSERALELFFQPLVTLVPRRIVGAEALARWDHPQYGMVPPSEFIPLAETAGLIPELGAWILRTACSYATKWDEVMLAVNLSPEQLRQPGLVDLVESTLVETGLPARRLELEITEGILLRDTDATVAKLTRLRALGVGIALDDFGTGYSSLSYLRRFPFSKLKVDRSFVAAMMTDSGTAAIVQAIASLGRSLDMRVTVEGIETEAQLEMIRATGCNEGQGYLLGRPCPPQAFEQLLRSDRSLARS
jgi:predicted signal transduction protein with EAL and GGDEF domain